MTAAAAITEGQYCAVAPGIQLHYASAGQPGRPLLLFVHGFPEYWGAWAGILPAFADHWHAVAPDLRGFNLSSKPDDVKAYRAPALIGDLAGLIAGLGHRQAVVVAHDWGGAVAWALAMARPELVARLVIINSPHPYTFWRALVNDPAQQSASRYMNFLREPDSQDKLLADDCAMLQSMLRGDGGAPWLAGDTLSAYLKAWQQPGAMRGGTNYYRASPMYPPSEADPGARRLNLDADDFRVRVPTRMLWGERDRALLPVLLDGLPALVDELTIERFPYNSHWIVHENPEAVILAIRAFIEPQRPD